MMGLGGWAGVFAWSFQGCYTGGGSKQLKIPPGGGGGGVKFLMYIYRPYIGL